MMNFVSKMTEFCIKNDEVLYQYEVFCVENDAFCIAESGQKADQKAAGSHLAVSKTIKQVSF